MQLCYCKLPLHTKTQFPNSEHEPDQPGDALHFFSCIDHLLIAHKF